MTSAPFARASATAVRTSATMSRSTTRPRRLSRSQSIAPGVVAPTMPSAHTASLHDDVRGISARTTREIGVGGEQRERRLLYRAARACSGRSRSRGYRSPPRRSASHSSQQSTAFRCVVSTRAATKLERIPLKHVTGVHQYDTIGVRGANESMMVAARDRPRRRVGAPA